MLRVQELCSRPGGPPAFVEFVGAHTVVTHRVAIELTVTTQSEEHGGRIAQAETSIEPARQRRVHGAKDSGGISMNLKHKSVGILAGFGCLVASSVALAQAQADANVGMTLPGAAPPAAAAGGASDHDQVVGRLAVGYLGRRSLAIGAAAAGGGPALELQAPVVGIRYWIDQMIGIDAGLGLFVTSGTWEVDNPVPPDADGDLLAATAFIIHAGVPLSLASADHFSFQIVPEVNVGIGSGSTDPDGDVKHNGFGLDAGARAGAEIQFGFMGIPQLSLQGSIGALLTIRSLKTDNDATDVTTTENSTTISTTVGDNPWNIFTSNVAALYYF
jgi:hypothetical protein